MTVITYDPAKPRFPDCNEYHPVVDWDLLVAQKPPLFVFKVGNGDVSPDPMSDPKWKDHLDGAESHGLIVGGYWFSDPQVDAFLSAFPPKEGRIPILDFEGNAQVAHSEAFVIKLHAEWGRWPWFYGHSLWIAQGEPEGTAIANCPYWGPTYGNDLSVPRGVGPVAAWQFTNGVFGPSGSPRSYQGVSGPCDISMLVESLSDLASQAGGGDWMATFTDAELDVLKEFVGRFDTDKIDNLDNVMDGAQKAAAGKALGSGDGSWRKMGHVAYEAGNP